MNQSNCPCETLERLEGASVPAYITAYLDQIGSNEEKNHFRCRVCSREWEKRAPKIKSEGTRASLIRLS
jgi:NAD dependent epimerase/dehydratase family enzyme